MKPFTLLQLFHLVSYLILTNGIIAQTIYVKSDAAGANDGTTWENAFTDFSEALDSASDGAVLWVAAGVYHPGDSIPDANSVFAVRQNISIYGGFAGTEVNLEDRDPSVNQTILSGDINEDDVEADFDTNKTDNTYHVLYVDSLLSLVIIDGLTIKGGQTTNASTLPLYLRAGGGIYGLSPVYINNCRFIGNFALAGGGIMLTKNASHSSIRACSFSYNKTTNSGAGVSVWNISDIVIVDCSFTDNETVRGALYPDNCKNVLVENCFFQNNHNTVTNGGALFSFQNRDLVIRHCQFNRNSTTFNGGAIVVNGGQISTDTLTNVRLENCSFLENVGQSGGAILLFTCPDILITNCEFKRDSATEGGAIYINQPQNYITDTNDIRIDSCLFEDNNAEGNIGGGAIFMRFTSVKVEHSLFDGNTTNPRDGGGGGHIFQNCPGEFVIYRDVSFQNGKSLGFGGATTSTGIDAQYLFEFCDFSYNSSQKTGGAQDNGGEAKFKYKNCIFNENVSMVNGGAINSYQSNDLVVSQCQFSRNSALSGGAINSYQGNDLAISQCQFSQNSALSGGAVFIEQPEDYITDSNRIRIDSCLFEGNKSVDFGGGALFLRFTSAKVEHSVFDGNSTNAIGNGGGGHVFQNCPDEYVIYRDVSFKNGQSFLYGGAITAVGIDAHYLFEFCHFSNNSSQNAGGAVDNGWANFIYKNCVFNENVSMNRGGALSLARDSTKVHIEHSTFTGNEAALDGGAISSAFGSQIIEVENCVLDSNRTLFGFGGAISMVESGNDNIASLNINNSFLRFNSSKIQGGALNIVDAETRITNCVFAENECDGEGFGGAMAIMASDLDTMEARIINTTIVGNHGFSADGIAQEEESEESSLITRIQNCIFNRQSSTNYTYNIEGGTPELFSLGGNMSDDESMIDFLTHSTDLNQTSPLFDFDYSLMSNSPGIDAGVAVADGAPEFDILGNPRVNEPDMGAYENQMPVSVKENIYRDQDALTVFPNPVKDQNPTGMLMNAWRGDLKVQLSDIEGRVVFSEKIQKPDELYLFTLSMEKLNTGIYQILISNGQKTITKNIVKVQ